MSRTIGSMMSKKGWCVEERGCSLYVLSRLWYVIVDGVCLEFVHSCCGRVGLSLDVTERASAAWRQRPAGRTKTEGRKNQIRAGEKGCERHTIIGKFEKNLRKTRHTTPTNMDHVWKVGHLVLGYFLQSLRNRYHAFNVSGIKSASLASVEWHFFIFLSSVGAVI